MDAPVDLRSSLIFAYYNTNAHLSHCYPSKANSHRSGLVFDRDFRSGFLTQF